MMIRRIRHLESWDVPCNIISWEVLYNIICSLENNYIYIYIYILCKNYEIYALNRFDFNVMYHL